MGNIGDGELNYTRFLFKISLQAQSQGGRRGGKRPPPSQLEDLAFFVCFLLLLKKVPPPLLKIILGCRKKYPNFAFGASRDTNFTSFWRSRTAENAKKRLKWQVKTIEKCWQTSTKGGPLDKVWFSTPGNVFVLFTSRKKFFAPPSQKGLATGLTSAVSTKFTDLSEGGGVWENWKSKMHAGEPMCRKSIDNLY